MLKKDDVVVWHWRWADENGMFNADEDWGIGLVTHDQIEGATDLMELEDGNVGLFDVLLDEIEYIGRLSDEEEK